MLLFDEPIFCVVTKNQSLSFQNNEFYDMVTKWQNNHQQKVNDEYSYIELIMKAVYCVMLYFFVFVNYVNRFQKKVDWI